MFDYQPDHKKANYVEFFTNAVESKVKSAAEGKPVFIDKHYIRIHTPGNTVDKVLERPVKERDKQEYAKQWGAYEEGLDQKPDGLDIALWSYATPAQVKMLKARSIFTVEQLANSGDNFCAAVPMWGREIRDAARNYLSSADDKTSRINSLEANLAKQAEEFETLKEQNQELIKQLNSHKESEDESTKRVPKRKS